MPARGWYEKYGPEFYDKQWRDRVEGRGRWPWQDFHERAMQFLAEPALDVGCGIGIFCNQAHSKGLFIVGIDFSKYALRHVKCPKVLASAEYLPFKSRAFAYVAALEVLEHLDDMEKGIEELKRVVRPDGRIFVSIPMPGFKAAEHKEQPPLWWLIEKFKPWRLGPRWFGRCRNEFLLLSSSRSGT